MQTRLKTIAKRVMGESLYHQLGAAYRRIHSVFRYGVKSRLKLIGIAHLTDKFDEHHSFAGWSYLDIYEKYFERFRNQKVSILEIGVRDGASLRTWKAYFRKGNVYGIDIDPRCKAFEEKRIHIEIGSQDDGDFLANCFGADKRFDIIIDDGSHVNRMTLASFEHLFDRRLNSGGIYIIEDLGCSYEKLQTDHHVLEVWPGMKYNDPGQTFDNDRKDMDDFFLEKIRKLDHRTGNVLSIHFWAMTCIIIKI
ncbi:MAG: class I SAM-dependent methyltransferase [Chloroflexi bacterium]|nr:class I SAM-dependent methyltransferase [Chloroflexota bacterium]